jgi:glycosyltransferase involved in cell wall biosynthesis
LAFCVRPVKAPFDIFDRALFMQKIIWFVSSLEQKGGGERFVLEGTAALQAIGHDVRVVCDRLDHKASFDGRYDLSAILCTATEYDGNQGYFSRIFAKARGMIALRHIISREKPDMVVCQSEYDAIKLYLLSRIIRFNYRVFVFGQMYQFKTDISRYAKVFRPYLETIIASRPGYRITVAMPPPKLSPLVRITNEFVANLKYRAHRHADRIFTLSKQVAWEVSLLYGREAVVARAAFDRDYIDQAALAAPRPLADPVRLISVSRLVDKKRVDLMIAGFSQSTLPATLTIIGTGPDELALQAQAAASSRSDDIRFLGSVDDTHLLAELALADCFISLDIGDYDISVVEAMGKARRVIVAQDFDLESFGDAITGAVSVAPTSDCVAKAINAIPEMAPPSMANMAALIDQSWQSLAQKISH